MAKREIVGWTEHARTTLDCAVNERACERVVSQTKSVLCRVSEIMHYCMQHLLVLFD